MQDIQTMLSQLRRPGLLIRAARAALEGYRREVHLSELLGQTVLPRHAAAALRLFEQEADLDRRRREGCGTYSVVRHVAVLTALIGEAAQLQA